MLKNYFTVAWRSLRNNKAFSLINIFGLALGMACSLLIFLWINDEVSMDCGFILISGFLRDSPKRPTLPARRLSAMR